MSEKIQLSDDDALEVEYRGRTCEIDTLKALHLYGGLEEKHRLKQGDNVTGEFLDDLVAAADRLGVAGATTGAALDLYRAVAAHWDKVKKKREMQLESPTGTGSTRAASRNRKRRASC